MFFFVYFLSVIAVTSFVARRLESLDTVFSLPIRLGPSVIIVAVGMFLAFYGVAWMDKKLGHPK